MNFSRGKVQTLYSYLPGAVFAHDEYGHCKVTAIEMTELPKINRSALAEVVGDTLVLWTEDWQRAGFPSVHTDDDLARNFIIGEPTSVRFEPFPTTLRCRRCERVYRLTDLRRSRARPGGCPQPSCGGSLEQIPFLQAHHCGRLDEIFVHRDGCDQHGTQSLYFDDTGRVATARWRCRQCGGAEVARLRQTPCTCDFSRFGTQDIAEQRLRFLVATDPAVFKPQIVPFINFCHDEMVRLNTTEARAWILARIWGMLKNSVKNALTTGPNQAADDAMESAIQALAELAPDHPEVQAWYQRQESRRGRTATAENVLKLLPGRTPETLEVSRRLLEQVAILDTVTSVDIAQAAKRIEDAGDPRHAESLRMVACWAREQLGILDVRALDGFPIGLAAMGYTRIKADPNQTILNAFPRINQRTPLYAVVATTEAIYLQIDAVQVVTWLMENRLLSSRTIDDLPEAWAYLYREIPGLRTRRGDPTHLQPAASAVRMLIHSISHVLLRHIESSGYGAQSIGEYLIPEGLACVLYASRYTDTKVGGLLTLFEQGLDRWLHAAHQEGRDCVMDPFCGEEGGACVGCLHREFNCTEFNRELSRAVLFGGTVAQDGQALVPFGPEVTGFWNKRPCN